MGQQFARALSASGLVAKRAHAYAECERLSMAASLSRGVSVGRVAQASGYASESAFSAMFKSAMGLPPTRLLARSRPRPQAAMASSTRA